MKNIITMTHSDNNQINTTNITAGGQVTTAPMINDKTHGITTFINKVQVSATK